MSYAVQSKITPCLWFDTEAEDAAAFYTAVFPDSRIVETTYYSDAVAEAVNVPAGAVMTVTFEIAGQRIVALNGGTVHRFNEAISLMVNCADQQEVDYFWSKLGEGGDPASQMCGWLKDRFGLSWQVVPDVLFELLRSEDKQSAERVTRALLKMKKLDIAELQRAAAG